MALTSISLNNGATVIGRLLARNGQVSLINNVLEPLELRHRLRRRWRWHRRRRHRRRRRRRRHRKRRYRCRHRPHQLATARACGVGRPCGGPHAHLHRGLPRHGPRQADQAGRLPPATASASAAVSELAVPRARARLGSRQCTGSGRTSPSGTPPALRRSAFRYRACAAQCSSRAAVRRGSRDDPNRPCARDPRRSPGVSLGGCASSAARLRLHPGGAAGAEGAREPAARGAAAGSQSPGARPNAHARLDRVGPARRPLTGVRTVLPVLGRTPARRQSWVHVRLPGRPNEHTGWIRTRQTRRASTAWRIAVDVSARRVTVYHHGRV